MASQKLTVQLPSHDLAESSNLDKGKGTKNVAGRKVTYTELKDTAPFEAAPLWLRYRNHHPFVHFLSVDREITVGTSAAAFLLEPCRSSLQVGQTDQLRAVAIERTHATLRWSA